MTNLLDSLNPRQRDAVTTAHGPVLVLAGAGSGKTRVIIHRIAHLIQTLDKPAGSILGVTFTNKAAGELQERLREMLGESSRGVHLSTFHALGVSLLRQSIKHLGYRPNFVIYDTQDQSVLLKSLLEEHDFGNDEGLVDLKSAHAEISRTKTAGLDAESLGQSGDRRLRIVGQIYQEYQRTLKGCNALDFDDILNLTLQLFERHPEAMLPVQERFRYILVDEYQDTNRVQYRLLRHLTQLHQNLCVVGDDDQSIYAWRGADVQNLLSFERDYPDVKVIRLEQNYRSTQVILDAANQVIANNPQRMPKRLWSEKPGGERISWIAAESEQEELETVVRRIRMQTLRHGRKHKNFAVLYRSNFQARAIEEAFRDGGVPYHVVGATSFYEQQEVRDVLAYLKVIHNPRDEVSLHRVINTPRRGIGQTSLMQANTLARTRRDALFRIFEQASQFPEIPRESAASMESFAWRIRKYQEQFAEAELGATARALVEEVGYVRYVEKQPGDPKTRERRRNCVLELLNGIDKYSRDQPQRGLRDYLERVMLFTERDSEGEASGNQVTLMTLHSAKGLEFPYVFLVGMADGVFPNQRTLDEAGVDEERRLCYVGITRAQRELTFSMATFQKRYGEVIKREPSRFLLEIDPELFSTPVVGEASLVQKTQQREQSRSDFFLQLQQMKAN